MKWKIIKAPNGGPHVYQAVAGKTWPDTSAAFTDLWLKVCEVLPRYYANVTPDWDCIICGLRLDSGRISAGPAKINGNRFVAAAYVGAILPAIEIKYYKISEGPEERAEREWAKLFQECFKLLSSAASSEPVASAIAQLKQWHRFSLYTTEYDDAETRRRLRLVKPRTT